jgi:hypothetical protein
MLPTTGTADGQNPSRPTINVWAFDLATETGFAMGRPPQALSDLNSGAIDLRTHGKLDCMAKDTMRLAVNLEQFLKDGLTFKEAVPDRIIYEAPMDPQWSAEKSRNEQAGFKRSSKSLLLPWVLAAKVEEIGHKYRIPTEKVYPITIRKAFICKENAGERGRTKQSILERCKELGYLPKKAKNDNVADAIAIWHWAQIRYGRWQPPFEVLFGKKLNIVGRA